nr:MAG TPA: hypothetical protein [Caudoviricetes sp.]
MLLWFPTVIILYLKLLLWSTGFRFYWILNGSQCTFTICTFWPKND